MKYCAFTIHLFEWHCVGGFDVIWCLLFQRFAYSSETPPPSNGGLFSKGSKSKKKIVFSAWNFPFDLQTFAINQSKWENLPFVTRHDELSTRIKFKSFYIFRSVDHFRYYSFLFQCWLHFLCAKMTRHIHEFHSEEVSCQLKRD